MPVMPLWTRILLRLTGVTGLVVLFGDTGLGAQLPVPCAAGSCAANSKTPGFTTPPTGFVTSGQASATQTGNTLTVSQSSAQAILNWSSFNISADGKVVFQQPGATSIALNKIYQDNPSSILGTLTANGQLYLINPNGFVFGSTATVNVAGLIASSLGLYNGDSELRTGILAPIKQVPPHPALASDGRVYVTDSSGNPVLDAQGKPQPVTVLVQQGAQIAVADGGRLMLTGQNVDNAGSLSAPDGQIILAAGQTVYLQASGDPSVRGLVVEVNSNGANVVNSDGTKAVGTVSNQQGGVLSTPRGNVSLIGLAVNQQGRISATTAVAANGSVVLQAAEGAGEGAQGVSCGANELLCAYQGGTLKIGTSSDISILPDLSDTSTAVVGQPQLQSLIQLTGQQVDIEGGKIVAPAGKLNVLAAANPDQGIVPNGNTAAQIRIASGASINLAGSNAELPMSANLVAIQLRSNELEDDPNQRSSTNPLHGQTVIVDVRQGKPAIISDSSWVSVLQAVKENIAQRTSAGGSASFKSEGDVVVNSGATIDVSGGKWTYAPGAVQTSRLIGANGRTYDITTADPSLAYTGVLNPTYTQSYPGFGVQVTQPTPGLSSYAPGYVQGFSAGKVTFAAPAMALQGTLIGTAVNGLYQRSPAAIPAESLAAVVANNGTVPTSGGIAMATGGTLVIGNVSPTQPFTATDSAGSPYFFAPPVAFASKVAPIVVAEGAPLPVQTLQLPLSYVTSGGFTQTQIYSDSTVTLPAGLPLNLGVGGSLQVVAPRVAIDSDITALGGSIILQSTRTASYPSSGAPRIGIDIANGVTLDVRGQWTNDSPVAVSSAVAPLYQNGGTIDLSLTSQYASTQIQTTLGGELLIGNGVSLRASGGAWVKANNSIVGGAGGSITLDASPYQSALQVGNNVSMDAYGVQGAAGGKFSLAAPRIEVAQGNGSWATAQRVDDLLAPGQAFKVGAGLFSQDGFSSVSLLATAPVLPSAVSGDLLTIDAGTVINAQAQTLQLSSGYLTRQTGGTVQDFTQVKSLPEAYRGVYSITLGVTPAPSVPPTTTIGTGIGDLHVQAGAILNADPKSTIALVSQGSILVDGVLRAPGGTITATIQNPTLVDYGYLAMQRIELGSQAVLDVSGTTVLTPNSQNLALGSVLSGGTISLIANRGNIVTDAGSLIDIAGASAHLDVRTIVGSGGYTAATVGSAGGSLKVLSSESISLLGNLSAAAGVSSTGNVQGGSLEVDLQQSGSQTTVTHPPGYQPFSSATPTIELISSTAGSSPSPGYGNVAVLGVAQLEQFGIDELKLQAAATGSNGVIGGVIAIDTAAPLVLARDISLDAPNISVAYGTAASVSAPYVALTDSNSAVRTALTAVGGTGSLNIAARQIVLSGFTALQGVGDASLTSSGDIEFEALDANRLVGGLTVAGNLTMSAARIYPATQTPFTISSSATNGTVTIGQTSASPGTPLSVAGSLSINAANIVSSGTILAPFGKITLAATNSLALRDGSVTSVSADGAVLPYGQTVAGQAAWVYSEGNNISPTVTAVPTRQVSLSAPHVSFSSGATIDVSGGGDLSAYEWVPGTRGSVDALGQSNASAAGLYAVLPSMLGQYAAYDLQEFTGSNVGRGGQSVYLSGVAGLPAGVYPLLPARYALLPGAYLIKVESGYQSLTPGTIGALADGTPVAAGYFTFGNTGLRSASGYTGFAVWPGSYSNSLARYDISNASSFFNTASAGKTQTPLPADAGTLLISAASSLAALGKVNSAPGTGGSAATIDIIATDLTVTAGSDGSSGNGVSIGASVLQSWSAGDLILGGQPEVLSDGTPTIAVTANKVTIGQGAQFSAGQVVVVANQSIDVQAGATIASTSGANGTALKTLPSSVSLDLTRTNASGAALLAVSDTSLPTTVRAAGASGGTINIETGATLSTRGAVALDAPSGVTVAGSINAPGAMWSLASNSIGFVGSGSSANDALQINSGLLSQMQTAGAIRLVSAGALDILTPVTLGAGSGSSAPTLGSLTLSAASIHNLAQGASVFGAQTLILQGTGAAGETTALATGGPLNLIANTLGIGGPGYLSLNGFSQTSLQVSGAVVGQAQPPLVCSTCDTVPSTLQVVTGDLVVSAAELTAASHSATSINVVGGNLQILQNGPAASASSLATSLGGDLRLAAHQIQDSGTIIVPGGRISMSASSDLALSSGAVVNASGITVGAGDQTVGAAGGIVNITAGGNLTLPSGAAISVAGAGTSPAGSLTLGGGGVVTLNATLSGSAAASSTGGSFSLTAGKQLVGGLSSALASSLTNGGFSNEIDIRVGGGDLNLAAGDTLTANRVTLAADTGAIGIAGVITAPSAGQRGFIGLYGGTGVTLTGQLHADGSGSSGRGGEIEISSTCSTCSVTLAQGSVITTAGAAQMGRLIVEAPVYGANDVAINVGRQGLGANVSAVGQVVLEPVIVDAQVTSATIGTALSSDVSQAINYLSAATPTISSRLATSDPKQVAVRAGLEIRDLQANDALTLPTLDLSSNSQQGQVIDLTVRAAGALTVSGNISDAYTINARGITTLSNSPSASLRLVAGADLSPTSASANPLATSASSAGTLSLAPGALVRTGTGDIALVASNDIVFGAGSSAYTSGIPGQAAQNVRGGAVDKVNFATGGGSVLVNAGHNVTGVIPTQPSVSDWLVSTVRNQLGQWGVNFDAFDQIPWTLATFGGGDLSVKAGHDAINISAATAGSTWAAPATSAPAQTHFPGGGLTVYAGRDITSGLFYVADGTGTLTAGRSFANNLKTATTPPEDVGSLFALQDSHISLWAEDSIAIAGTVNPTSLPQPIATAQFYTYGSNSGLSAQSSSGSVTLLPADGNTTNVLLGDAGARSLNSTTLYPASLRLVSLTDNVELKASTSLLYPSDRGQLQFFAGHDIVGAYIAMSDAADGDLPTSTAPLAGNPTNVLETFSSGRHINDPTAASIVAGRDITNLQLLVPKSGRVEAGRDIVNLAYNGQNLNSGDLTLIYAGRDFTDPTTVSNGQPTSSGLITVQVGGPGSLDVLAGRNINLGFSVGVATVGNQINPNLSTPTGAAITMAAGLGQNPDYAGFLQKVIEPSSTYQQQLVAYVGSLTGQSNLSLAQAEAAFSAFNADQQRPFIDEVFFSELDASGHEANDTPKLGYTRGYAAIDTLFPASRTGASGSGGSPYSGDLSMTYSRIYTVAGGDISLLVPGGKINVGLANPPASSSGNAKAPSQLGIVSQGSGNVDIYSKGNVDVNSSRIFTIGGGNILIWSDEGSIDAGNGAKTSLSLPPPTYTVDLLGNVQLVFNAAVAGSGIRTIQTSPSQPAGNVNLIAPIGSVNAGDAGIGAAGNINIAAVTVTGVANINFGGTATGVPPQVSGLTASLSGAASAASSATTSVTSSLEAGGVSKEEAAPLAQSAISWLDVFVTGLGEENCKADDLECLKRQKRD